MRETFLFVLVPSLKLYLTVLHARVVMLCIMLLPAASSELDPANSSGWASWCTHESRLAHMSAATLEKYVDMFASSALGAEKVGLWPLVAGLAKNLTGIPSRDNCLPGSSFKPSRRLCGDDWPCTGYTMVGIVRLMNVAALLKSVVDDGVQGAFAELGVWRGGTCIFARKLLDLLSQGGRRVEVFDAFESLPGYGKSADFLMNSQDSVKENFRLAGAPLDRTHFHKGLFKDSVPAFSREHSGSIAILRVDGNFYDSYQDAMYYLYERVPVGGYVIFDDIMSHPAVMRFWNDFRADQGVVETLVRIDAHSAYFRKTRAVTVDMTRMHVSDPGQAHNQRVSPTSLPPQASATWGAPCGFRSFFDSNLKGPGIHKWLHYFPAYEREFGDWCDESKGRKPVRMLEIGIQSGGSCKMWLTQFGKHLEQLVGVDINPATRAWMAFSPKLHVEIASQDDPNLWKTLRDKYASFDIILDDGSHETAHMVASFLRGFNLIRPGGVYLIEDITQENAAAVHRILMGDGKNPQEDTGLQNLTGQFYSHPTWSRQCCNFSANWAQANIEYIAMYPMMLAIRKSKEANKADKKELSAPRHGSQWIPYGFLGNTSARARARAGGVDRRSEHHEHVS